MKKTIITAILIGSASLALHAQGFINFQGYVHGVGNNFTTPGTVTYSTGIDFELLFAPASTATAVSAIASSSSPASLSYNASTAWSDITGDANFSAVDGTAGAGSTALIGTTATGGGTYNGSSAYSVANLTAGTTYTFYEVAWSTGGGLYTTLAQAAAANTYVGWSQAFQYTPTVSGNPPPATFNSGLVPAYDVGGVVAPVPEPMTAALAGLGGLALLGLRRRK